MRRYANRLLMSIVLITCLSVLLSACESSSIAIATPATATPIPHPLPVPPDNPPPLPSPGVLETPTPGLSTPTQVPLPTVTVTPTLAPDLTPTPTVPQIPTPVPCPPSYATPTVTYTPASVMQDVVSGAQTHNLPLPLVEAIISSESSWQPNVIACNGDLGLMQLSTSTAQWINQFFGLNGDPLNPQDAVEMGDTFIAYYYNYYIGYLQRNDQALCGASGCTWDTAWPDASDGATVRDIVISIYNEGAGTMAKYGILNWWYVHGVLYHYHTQYGGSGN